MRTSAVVVAVARAVALTLLAIALASCGGGSGQPSAPTIARLEVTPNALMLTELGQAKALKVRAFDSNGQAVASPALTFTSSNTSQVTVGADGVVRSMVSVGSAVVRVAAGNVRADPVFVAVVQPAPGAVLLDDAQILVPPSPVLGTGENVGDRFTLTVNLPAAPAAGAPLLASESAPVAGRVLLASPVATGYEVVYEIVPLDELVQDVSIAADFAPEEVKLLQAEKVSQEMRIARPGVRPLASTRTFGSFECSMDFDPALATLTLTPKITPTLAAALNLQIARRVVQAFLIEAKGGVDASLTGTVGFAAATGSIECDAPLATINIPITGWLSPFVAPQVPLKLRYKVELSAATNFQVGARVDVNTNLVVGLKYDNGRGWTNINRISGSATTDVARALPNTAARVEFNSFAGLVAGVTVGSKVAGVKFPSALEVTAGREETSSWGAPFDAANDPIFNPSDEIDASFAIGPGPGLAQAVKKISRSLPLLDVDLSAALALQLATSPQMTVGNVNRSEFVAGDALSFTIKLDPTTVKWGALAGLYNVEEVRVYRVGYAPGGEFATLFASAPAIDGQTDFTFTARADAAGSVVNNGASLEI